MKYLIVGLGNIGSEYDSTRHNIGFDVVDVLVMQNKGMFSTDKLASVSTLKIKGKTLVVIKPTTYMNLSGKAVKYWMDKEKISLENVLVVVDDLSLPLDVLRLRPAGTHAGHNGLKDIQETLQTDKYAKLRFGIGDQFAKGRQVEFVLGKWKPTEIEMVKHKILLATEMIESFALQGLERTMNMYNKKKID